MQLKPTDIAILAKLGIDSVQVHDRPKVLIIPTGNELIKRGGDLRPGAVYESNGLMCKLLLTRCGADPMLQEIVQDNVGKLKDALYAGQSYDLVITIGGSSASKRDLMEETTCVAGKLAFHEVALHPGNHMGAGKVVSDKGSTPLIFLAGYTESCAVGAMVFANAAIRKLGHYPPIRYARERAVLESKVRTPLGVRAVRKMCVVDGKATPVMLIAESFRTGRYPYLIVPEDVVEYEAGEEVECVHLE
jgi:molybdopterin molybdotransferase